MKPSRMKSAEFGEVNQPQDQEGPGKASVKSPSLLVLDSSVANLL